MIRGIHEDGNGPTFLYRLFYVELKDSEDLSSKLLFCAYSSSLYTYTMHTQSLSASATSLNSQWPALLNPFQIHSEELSSKFFKLCLNTVRMHCVKYVQNW